METKIRLEENWGAGEGSQRRMLSDSDVRIFEEAGKRVWLNGTRLVRMKGRDELEYMRVPT